MGDFLSINRRKIEIVAVTGNSMGWYTTLACGGALTAEAAFRVTNTMGTLMQQSLIGGQLVYPVVSSDWVDRPERRTELLTLVAEIALRPDCELFVSIELGGMLVLAGNAEGLRAFSAAVEPVDQRFPMTLANHAAFHTPLVAQVSRQGRDLLSKACYRSPEIPMIDGRGAIWWPGASDPAELYEYTLGKQVVETFDFTRAVTVAAREFSPEIFIVAGPGNTLGSAVAQSLIHARWLGMASKTDFLERQRQKPLLVSMGLQDQRGLVTG